MRCDGNAENAWNKKNPQLHKKMKARNMIVLKIQSCGEINWQRKKNQAENTNLSGNNNKNSNFRIDTALNEKSNTPERQIYRNDTRKFNGNKKLCQTEKENEHSTDRYPNQGKASTGAAQLHETKLDNGRIHTNKK